MATRVTPNTPSNRRAAMARRGSGSRRLRPIIRSLLTSAPLPAQSTRKFVSALPGLYAEIVNRILRGIKIIDHERIFGVRAAPFEVVVIYEVVGDLIERARSFAPDSIDRVGPGPRLT